MNVIGNEISAQLPRETVNDPGYGHNVHIYYTYLRKQKISCCQLQVQVQKIPLIPTNLSSCLASVIIFHTETIRTSEP